MLWDQSIEKAKTLVLLLQSSCPEEVSVNQVHVNLLANILETNLGIDCDLMGLEYCSREDTNSFYHTASEILSHSATL